MFLECLYFLGVNLVFIFIFMLFKGLMDNILFFVIVCCGKDKMFVGLWFIYFFSLSNWFLNLFIIMKLFMYNIVINWCKLFLLSK